ncbi:hypothetical protein [Silvibacterium dinghuense]|uniref:Uncharacterized protein n=1 Tax=Silvibacterium dinghuense TaxID=1560006 RepID=A0A4Q1SB99_9BACT|nr:hypothetical protein [Silvibacterium dinghuense]RXS94335.1 hypothetical protein ESZ00_14680 [Silvibacterium dinghuense]GGH16824.1 hypothetical protein GCM10011586_38950 [Silvibacterium dinghuense]
MRSEQIHRAIAQGHSRFDICQIVGKGIRVIHKPGSRFEDSITAILDQLSEQKGRSWPSTAGRPAA